MILPSKYYIENSVVKGFSGYFKNIWSSFSLNFRISRRSNRSLKFQIDKLNLIDSEEKYYPALMLNEDKTLKCISCNLCEQICPTSCINIEKDKSFNIPSTLQIGPTPLSFKIEMKKCTRCNLCSEICPVEAICLVQNYDFFNELEKEEWNIEELSLATKKLKS